jgi:peptidoglycan/xylan/chitin deacetylase (PgdA/CDA1 family)
MTVNRSIKVLMYHGITAGEPADKGDLNAVYKHNFYRQLRLLDRLNFTSITFEDYYLYLKGKLSLPQKPIILTFDDNYGDMLKTVPQVLQQFNMKAVVFVEGKPELPYLSVGRYKGQKTTNSRAISDEQILELRAEGFEIGIRGVAERDLRKLNIVQIQREISRSKQSIETLLNEEILSFAYPFGQVSKKLEKIVAECGFKFGCGEYSGPPKFGDNLYDIRRITINHHTSIFQFLLKILTPYEYAEWLYTKTRNHRKDRF